MNAASLIRKIESYGVTLTALDGALKLSGDQTAVNAVVHLVKQHKAAILNELTGGPPLSIPSNLTDALLSCGYPAPEWTPEGCRAFLSELQAEWPGFEVRGWHGCRFPECWPVHLSDAVTTVYVMSIQGEA